MSIKDYLTDPDPEVTAKQLNNLEQVLEQCDELHHPLQELSLGKKKIQSDPSTPTPPPKPESRHKYVPSWWLGEEKAFQIAQAARGGLSSLPKMNP